MRNQMGGQNRSAPYSVGGQNRQGGYSSQGQQGGW